MNQISFTRKELYDLVWAEPMLALSKKYNISDNGLRKICVRMKIPLPSAGHWQKIQHGKRVRIIDLPPDYLGENVVKLEVVTEDTQRRSTPAQEIKVRQLEIESELGQSLEVPSKLTKPDLLIVAAKASLLEISKREYSFSRPGFKPYEVLDIFISKNQIGRALCFFDTLIKVLQKRNHSVEIIYNSTEAVLFGEKVELKLREKSKKTSDGLGKWDSTKYVPTGVLYLTTHRYPEHTWTDGKLPLEKQLANIIAYLEIKAQKRQKQRIENEISQRRYEERKRLQKELEQKQDNELDNFKLLLKKVKRWQQLKLIRGYIDELEAKNLETGHQSEDMNDWIAWARKKADWYDPHVNSEDELLKGVDKEQLIFRSRNVH